MEKLKKILVIDDEKMNIIALAHFLKPEYDIIISTESAAALEIAEKHLPDIILLDIIMPDMDGFDVITKLKESEKVKDIPVIFISGLNNEASEEKGIALGAADYLIKPFNKIQVKTRIETQLKLQNYKRMIEELTAQIK